MSRTYEVISGDTLSLISVKCYGTASNWRQIYSANPQLEGRKTSIDGVSLIYPGDILIIPSNSELPVDQIQNEPEKISSIVTDDFDNDFTFYIGGKLYGGFTGYSVVMSMDSLDVFSFQAPWDSNDSNIHDAFKPFVYKDCAVYFRKKLLFSGKLMVSAPEITPDSRIINIQGYSNCAVLNDCCIPVTKYPPSYNGLTLEQIAQDVCEPFGVGVKFSEDSGDPIEKVEYSIGMKVLDFLKKLAEQKNFIFTNDAKGDLYFWKVPEESCNVFFKEGEINFLSCKPDFNQQQMFSHITGFTKTDKKNDASQYTYENQLLIKNGVFRPLSFVCEDVDAGGLEKAVKTRVGQMYSDCCSYVLTVYGCTDKNNNIYKKGMSVSVFAPGAMIYRETKFQVKELTIKKSDTEGLVTVFKLILPNAINGELPDKLPWDED